MLDRLATGDILPLDRGAAGCILLAFAGEPGNRFDAGRGPCGPEAVLLRAVSLSGPAERFTAEMIATWAPRVTAAAAQLSAALGLIPHEAQR